MQITPDEIKAIARVFEQLSKNICHICGQPMTRQVQCGRCVCAEPCGHRIYQGTVEAFAPQP